MFTISGVRLLTLTMPRMATNWNTTNMVFVVREDGRGGGLSLFLSKPLGSWLAYDHGKD